MITNYDDYVVVYPDLNHLLVRENKKTREAYYRLIEHLSELAKSKLTVGSINYKLSILREKLDIKSEPEPRLSKDNVFDLSKIVFKRRFRFFFFYNLAALLIYDYSLLFAVTDKAQTSNMCATLDGYSKNKYNKCIYSALYEIYSGKSFANKKTLITEEMYNAWCTVQRYAITRKKEFVFTATMSAGKSTLINALIGSNIMQSKNAVCTSAPIKFTTRPTIRDSFCIFAKEGSSGEICAKEARQFMKNKAEFTAVLGEIAMSPLSNSKVVFVDTPGVNSALHKEHREITRTTLNKAKDIVYVFPLDNYESDDGYIHLKYIKDKIKYDNIIFVVNMFDGCKLEDESIEDIIDDVIQYLEQIGFEDPMVYPISAKAGLLLKRVIIGDALTDNERSEVISFVRIFTKPEMALTKYSGIPVNFDSLMPKFYFDKALNEDYEQMEIDKRQIWEAYINTGIPGLEVLLKQPEKRRR